MGCVNLSIRERERVPWEWIEEELLGALTIFFLAAFLFFAPDGMILVLWGNKNGVYNGSWSLSLSLSLVNWNSYYVLSLTFPLSSSMEFQKYYWEQVEFFLGCSIEVFWGNPIERNSLSILYYIRGCLISLYKGLLK